MKWFEDATKHDEYILTTLSIEKNESDHTVQYAECSGHFQYIQRIY